MEPRRARRLEDLLAPVAVLAVVGLVVAFVALRPDGGPDGDPEESAPPATASSSGASSESPRASAAPVAPRERAGADGGAPLPSAPLDPLATDIPDPSCGTPEPPTRLTALTLNVAAPPATRRYRWGRLVEELQDWDADVLLLQEVDRFRDRTGDLDGPRLLARRLDLEVAFGPAARWPGDGRRAVTGNVVLSRYPVLTRANSTLPSSRGSEPRGLMGARVEVEGHPVDLYSTVLDQDSGAGRTEQSEQIAGVLGDDEQPTLLGGDLGAVPDGEPLRVATADALRDAWAEVGRGPGATVPAGSPRRRHDYQLHDDAFRPVSAQVLRSDVAGHRAVRVTYDVTLTPACLPPGSVN